MHYKNTHCRYGLVRSMTDGYGYCQNVLDERVNDILKRKLLPNQPAYRQQAAKMMAIDSDL